MILLIDPRRLSGFIITFWWMISDHISGYGLRGIRNPLSAIFHRISRTLRFNLQSNVCQSLSNSANACANEVLRGFLLSPREALPVWACPPLMSLPWQGSVRCSYTTQKHVEISFTMHCCGLCKLKQRLFRCRESAVCSGATTVTVGQKKNNELKDSLCKTILNESLLKRVRRNTMIS